MTVHLDTLVYTRDRSAVYRGYIDNFDTIDNFDMSDKSKGNALYNRVSNVSIFIDIPKNLSVDIGDTLRIQ